MLRTAYEVLAPHLLERLGLTRICRARKPENVFDGAQYVVVIYVLRVRARPNHRPDKQCWNLVASAGVGSGFVPGDHEQPVVSCVVLQNRGYVIAQPTVS